MDEGCGGEAVKAASITPMPSDKEALASVQRKKQQVEEIVQEGLKRLVKLRADEARLLGQSPYAAKVVIMPTLAKRGGRAHV